MTVPLATLRRGGQLIWLHDVLARPARPPGPPAPAPAASAAAVFDPRRGEPRMFMQASQAEDWLRFWQGDVAAMAMLRQLAQRLDPGGSLIDSDGAELLRRLAGHIAGGALAVTESPQPRPLPILPAAPAAPAVAEPPAVPISQVLAPPVPPPPLLPLLEEVRIEGAEVLPEIEQSLEQVNISIGEIQLAPVSLEPAPSKVPAIQDAMQQAGDDVTGTLDKL